MTLVHRREREGLLQTYDKREGVEYEGTFEQIYERKVWYG